MAGAAPDIHVAPPLAGTGWLRAELDPTPWVFTTLAPGESLPGALYEAAGAVAREAEGVTLVLPETVASGAHRDGTPLTITFPCRRITLRTTTDLAATGVMAAVSSRLAAVGIPCNPVAGFHHDHLYVPAGRAAEAAALLAAPARAADLLVFWFGPLDAHGCADAEHLHRWFTSSPEFDDTLRRQFGDLHDAALRGAARGGDAAWRDTPLAAWTDSPLGRLALVVLLDQLSRNLRRGTAEAFSGDAAALALARAAIVRGDEAHMALEHRALLTMPFEHAEDPAAQEVSLARFEALGREAPPGARERFRQWLGHAREHADIVARFGRYPHRNAVLGRAGTADEQAYLDSAGKRFGQ